MSYLCDTLLMLYSQQRAQCECIATALQQNSGAVRAVAYQRVVVLHRFVMWDMCCCCVGAANCGTRSNAAAAGAEAHSV
jgi:hypothetical protein